MIRTTLTHKDSNGSSVPLTQKGGDSHRITSKS